MTNKITFFQFENLDSRHENSSYYRAVRESAKLPRLQKKLNNLEVEIKNVKENKAQLLKDYNKQKDLLKEEISDWQREISHLEQHERISIKDLNDLNNKIDEMNEKGWNVKQIEGIQSGVYSVGHVSDGGYGYGYSFTEGMMIVWEKE